MIKVDKGGGGVKNVWILVDVNKERSLSTKLSATPNLENVNQVFSFGKIETQLTYHYRSVPKLNNTLFRACYVFISLTCDLHRE